MTATDLNGVVRVLESLPWFPEASRPVGVLIASPDLDLRLLLAHHLENLGFSIFTVGCGTDAYETAVEHPLSVDVLLCDEALTDLPVPELYTRMKNRWPGLRCCVLATTRQKTRAKEAARLGAELLDISGAAEPVEAGDLALAGGW